MGEKPTVAFRVDADTKTEWSEAVEQSDEYASLSHLIKKAVNRELRATLGVGATVNDPSGSELHGGGATTGGEAGASSQQMGELIDTVENLRGEIDGLEGAVTDATRSMNAGGGVSEDTTTKVFTALPHGPERATTAEGIAEGTDLDADTALLALESIADTAAVKRIDTEKVLDDGGTKVVEWEGQTIEIETGAEVVKRNEPLWFREA